MSDHIPPDVYRNIFSRLPIESLLRFRCVSKSWHRIIDSEDLIKLHLHHQSAAGTCHLILEHLDSSKLYALSTELLWNCYGLDDVGSQIRTNTFVYASPLGLETRAYNSAHVPNSLDIEPACHGLALIRYDVEPYNEQRSYGERSRHSWMLWNPFTRETLRLPQLTNYEQLDNIGLGYDNSSDDYKVVTILYDDCSRCWKTFVYSLKLNSWSITNNECLTSILFRTTRIVVVDPSSVLFVTGPGVFVNEKLHWILTIRRGSTDDNKEEILMLLVFDLASQIYQFLPLPPNSSAFPRDLLFPIMRLDALGESLLLTCPFLSIYRLNDYGGNMNSWTEFVSYENDIGLSDSDHIVPIAYLKTKGLLLLHKSDYLGRTLHLYLYNIENKSTNYIFLRGSPSFHDHKFRILQNCMPSRVRLNNGIDPSNDALKTNITTYDRIKLAVETTKWIPWG